MALWQYTLFFCAAYVWGSLPFGEWVGRYLGTEPHRLTRLGVLKFRRVIGSRRSAIIVTVDILKGAILPLLIHCFAGTPAFLVTCATLFIIGHCWSPFLRFQSSRGTTVFLGIVLGLTPLGGVLILLIWFLITRRTQSAELALVGSCAVLLALAPFTFRSWPIFGFLAGGILFLLYAHRHGLWDYLDGRVIEADIFSEPFSAGLKRQIRPGSNVPMYSLSTVIDPETGERGPACGRLYPAQGGTPERPATCFGFVTHIQDAPRDLERFKPGVTIVSDPEAIERIKRQSRITVVSEGCIVLKAKGEPDRLSFGAVAILSYEPQEFHDPAKQSHILRDMRKAITALRQMGCKMIGLGASTSPITLAGQVLEREGLGPVTSGNGLTAWSTVDVTQLACRKMGIDPKKAILAVIGASGSVGSRAAAGLIKLGFKKVILAAQDRERLNKATRRLEAAVPAGCKLATAANVADALRQADVIVSAVTSKLPELNLNDPRNVVEEIKPGAVMIITSVPPDVDEAFLRARPDILCVQGGIYSLPGEIGLGEELGMGAKSVWACMLQTLILAALGHTDSYDIGIARDTTEMDEMQAYVEHYNIRLAALRMLDRRIGDLQFFMKRLATVCRRLRLYLAPVKLSSKSTASS